MSRNCSLVLNAHVPWVRHLEVEHRLEEDWFHASILETHLPLLEMLHRLRDEGIPFQLTLNLSPTFLAMLSDRSLKRRCLAYLDRTLRLCQEEVRRGNITGYRELAIAYEERFRKLRSLFVDQWQGNLVRAYTDLRDSGHLEITASAATHGLLPLLMRSPESVRAQVRAGFRQYVQSFGRMPRGFWLPECAFSPPLAQLLKDEGVEWTIVEEHGLTGARHCDDTIPFVPARTPEGLVVFGRHQESSSEIWDADEGFPSDPRYRDFMRDIGIDAPLEYLADYLDGSDERQFTGIKYFRSGSLRDGAALYEAESAGIALEEHIQHFVASRGAQLAAIESNGVENPHLVCAFDADLFGHWWFEGTQFLEGVFRMVASRHDFVFTTPGLYLQTNRGRHWPTVAPVSSSWGEGGYFETWTSEENNWMVPEIQRRVVQLSRAVRLFEEERAASLEQAAHPSRQRCLQVMTRELLLAQASDWSFLMRSEASRTYAECRFRQHLENFDEAGRVAAGLISEKELESLVETDPIFPDLPWNIFESIG